MTSGVDDQPARRRRLAGCEAMMVLEAVAPIAIGIAALVLLILAFVGSSSNYP
ncbi:MAG TPA: hypothetical protein VGI72_14010 [Gaiellales bacterium]|jgi:hypothetical protein